jgi:uncharacterized protein (DUF433 family)
MTSREDSKLLLYGGKSPEEKPRYSIARGARYLHVSPSTLRSWVRGRTYPKGGGTQHWPALIKAETLLSFNNLIEAYVLRALRVDHGVRMGAVRQALDYAEKEFAISHLLLSIELQAAPGHVFLERFGQLINLNLSGQLAAKRLLDAVLQRVNRNPLGLPDRMFPVGSYDIGALKLAPRLIMIDPAVSFGRPILVSKGIRTSAIVGRIDAGEKPDDIARDYGLRPDEIDAALFYERSAA